MALAMAMAMAMVMAMAKAMAMTIVKIVRFLRLSLGAGSSPGVAYFFPSTVGKAMV